MSAGSMPDSHRFLISLFVDDACSLGSVLHQFRVLICRSIKVFRFVAFASEIVCILSRFTIWGSSVLLSIVLAYHPPVFVSYRSLPMIVFLCLQTYDIPHSISATWSCVFLCASSLICLFVRLISVLSSSDLRLHCLCGCCCVLSFICLCTLTLLL